MPVTITVLFSRILNAILGVIAFFLVLRIVLRFFEANAQAPFVAWIYAVSDYFIAPFRGMFGNLNVGGFGTLDVVAMLALLMYALLITLIIAVIGSVTNPHHVHTDEHVHEA